MTEVIITTQKRNHAYHKVGFLPMMTGLLIPKTIAVEFEFELFQLAHLKTQGSVSRRVYLTISATDSISGNKLGAYTRIAIWSVSIVILLRILFER